MKSGKDQMYSSKILKSGAVLSETKILLANWDDSASPYDNFNRFRESNILGKASRSRVEDILQAFRQRYLNEAQIIKTTDFHVEAINLLNNHLSCDAGIGLVVAIYSALMKQPVLPSLLVLGDLSIQGNIKAVRSLAEPLQIGMDNGARCALIPLENKRHFLDVSADIIERVDPIFYGEPFVAARKALGMK